MPLEVTRKEVITMAQRLRRQVSTPSRVKTDTYLLPAQALYQWLVAPLEAELEAQGIDTISFITDAGLRSTPLATLHDGEKFIIEKNYNIGLMPSLSLTDLTYQDIRTVEALLTGTAAFADQADLPGVPVELNAIFSKWQGPPPLQDQDFTLDKLIDARQEKPYGIVHL
ncbi:MAG: CHAT domain-containing protein, partial [Cyanobacteria bacterium J06642_11]